MLCQRTSKPFLQDARETFMVTDIFEDANIQLSQVVLHHVGKGLAILLSIELHLAATTIIIIIIIWVGNVPVFMIALDSWLFRRSLLVPVLRTASLLYDQGGVTRRL